jgi:Tol biopolymer transport system component
VLTPGQSLLHFRLVEKIGEGGMGEVWKAIDTTLDREVAVKVLPQAFASDPLRLARFEREAKLLASLSHTNIATIHGLHEDGGVRFLAMELVRGEDLAQIIARGPLSPREAIDAAKQVASALEAAHDSGVIHRDLKPANVKRTPEGQIKVLDFGLAKALESAGGLNSGQSATVTSAGSAAGMILGTASYMSPEQARGQAVDRRTDLWAFGCLLYEMLTGAKTFAGDTVTDVLAAVITGEPDWTKLPPSIPASVRRLLRRCLEKDARKRLRDAGDASLLLDENPEDARTGPVPMVPASRSLAPLLIAAVIAAAGLAGGWWIAHRADPAKDTASSEVSFHRVSFARGMMRSARFAPDGRTIVYGAAWGGPPIKLYLARTDSAESTPIALPPAELMSISKSGEMAVALGLAYSGWIGDGTLARTSLLGGAPREIREHVRSADWSPDGSQFAIAYPVALTDRLEYPIGKVLDTTNGYFSDVRISPDGEHVAYSDHPAWGDNQGRLSIVDRSGKKISVPTSFSWIQGVAWAPGGDEVWFTGSESGVGSALYASDLSGQIRVVYPSVTVIELFDIAADGRLLLGSHIPERGAVALLEGDREPRSLVVPGETSLARTISRDGRTVLVANQLPKTYESYMIRSDRPGASSIGEGETLAISPDGNSALLSSTDYSRFSVAPLGIGSVRTVPNPDGIAYLSIPSWLPDGRRFIVTAKQGSDTRAFVRDVTTGAGEAFGPAGLHWNQYYGPPVSPDGKFVVLKSVGEQFVRCPLDGGAPMPIPGLLPDDEPVTWTEDGAALFVVAKSAPTQFVRLDLASGRRTPWLNVAPTDSAGLRFSIASITPNGKFWCLSVSKLLTDLYVVDGLR